VMVAQQPLGYDTKKKKLVINKGEAETVRYIFKRYLELQSFAKLVEDLDRKGIVTKRRDTKVRKYQGGIPFTYGPLAHFLKNRLYTGVIGHKDKWFPGEHAGIVDRKTFDQVQQLLKSSSVRRKATRSPSQALLQGKLYDERGNLMSPSYSTKNGIRYRFYVSSALLRGRKDAAGSIARIPAAEIEDAVVATLKSRVNCAAVGPVILADMLERVILEPNRFCIRLSGESELHQEIVIPWSPPQKHAGPTMEGNDHSTDGRNESLIRSVVRAHAWVRVLQDGTYGSVEELADANKLHPKVVRQNLRLAFLSSEVTATILEGSQPTDLSLALLPKLLPLKWTGHRSLLG
jgi:site-specific DNA recombinase